MDIWINSFLRWLLEFYVEGGRDNGSHLERITQGGRYYDMLLPGGPLTSRTVEFLKPGSQQVAPESTSEYRVFFENGFHCAKLVRGADNLTSPPSCSCASDDI
jgi:hypothetical protein